LFEYHDMIRPILVFLALAVTLAAHPAQAQSGSLLRSVANAFTMAEGESVDFRLQCPAGYIPVNYSLTLGRPFDQYQQISRDLISRTGGAVDRQNISNASQIEGGGYSVSLFNDSHHTHNIVTVATCIAIAASADNTLVIAKASSTAASNETGTVTSFCPANAPNAIAGFSNANGNGLQDYGSAPVWGTSGSPLALADVPDGQTGPPTGWQMKVFNGNIPRETIISYAVCANVPSLQTFVYSSPTAFGNFDSVFGPVPDGWTAVGSGFDGAELLTSDTWVRDGLITTNLLWFRPSTYDSGSADTRAFMARGITVGLQVSQFTAKAGSRAVLAVLAIPQSGNVPPPVSVDIIEYYNAALDHYFVTAIPDEIAKLDNGTFVGWARTGQTFKAYAVGSSGRTGRRPVCRAYGLPSAGLNTHFYSASPDECFNTLSNLYGSWALEASEVFEMDLPDRQTGACPAGDVPVYRVWNQRFDSNHRYTTSTAIRDQMVAKGGVAEGYGPSAVALCALP
jgi:hypothetical protein